MDTIGIIVPFCSIYPDQKEIRKGIENLKIGFNVKFGKNLDNYIIQLASLNKKLVILMKHLGIRKQKSLFPLLVSLVLAKH